MNNSESNKDLKTILKEDFGIAVSNAIGDMAPENMIDVITVNEKPKTKKKKESLRDTLKKYLEEEQQSNDPMVSSIMSLAAQGKDANSIKQELLNKINSYGGTIDLAVRSYQDAQKNSAQQNQQGIKNESSIKESDSKVVREHPLDVDWMNVDCFFSLSGRDWYQFSGEDIDTGKDNTIMVVGTKSNDNIDYMFEFTDDSPEIFVVYTSDVDDLYSFEKSSFMKESVIKEESFSFSGKHRNEIYDLLIKNYGFERARGYSQEYVVFEDPEGNSWDIYLDIKDPRRVEALRLKRNNSSMGLGLIGNFAGGKGPFRSFYVDTPEQLISKLEVSKSKYSSVLNSPIKKKESVIKEKMIGKGGYDNSHWIYDADGEGRFDIDLTGEVTWKNGTWEDGAWKSGTWEGGSWEGGSWENGTWKGGVWEKGTWEKGTWESGFWYNGTWKNGTWERGLWVNGTWKSGTWKNGTWFNGTWEDGIWENGKWSNGTWENGTWKTGWIYDPKKKGNFKPDWEWSSSCVKSPINPKDYFDSSKKKESVIKKKMVNTNEEMADYKNRSHWIYKAKGKGSFTFNKDYVYWQNGTFEGGLWKKGTFLDGTWENGTWADGYWLNGVWQDGYWEDGSWVDGTWKNGIWFDGSWYDGTWLDGTWENGHWKDGTWKNGTWKSGWVYDPEKKGNFEKDWDWWGLYVKSPINPKDYFDPNYKLKKNINDLGESKKFKEETLGGLLVSQIKEKLDNEDKSELRICKLCGDEVNKDYIYDDICESCWDDMDELSKGPIESDED